MDCAKVGRLIFTLRKEKGITQRQLAEKMSISDKTISKWERGMGCPDVSLLPELSDTLGVNIEKILLGELSPNSIDGGNMKKIKFFVCPECGNILTATGSAESSCCGRKLEALTAAQADEGHMPFIQEVEDDFYITFNHEMTKQHYLSFASYVTYNSMIFIRLYPEQSAEVRFQRHYGGDLYYYCTEHGLMKVKFERPKK